MAVRWMTAACVGVLITMAGCRATHSSPSETNPAQTHGSVEGSTRPAGDDGRASEESAGPSADTVVIEAVSASGASGAYNFAVTLRSPDTGCDLYADWWEVLDAQGRLVYRRVLAHSHVNEQPFTRSGGPVAVDAADRVYVRAHLHPVGYGDVVFEGSVDTGFVTGGAGVPEFDASMPEFDASIEREAPQPPACAM